MKKSKGEGLETQHDAESHSALPARAASKRQQGTCGPGIELRKNLSPRCRRYKDKGSSTPRGPPPRERCLEANIQPRDSEVFEKRPKATPTYVPLQRRSVEVSAPV